MKALSGLFKSDGGTFVGLDIGSYSVKIIVLSTHGKNLQLTNFAIERISNASQLSNTVGKITSRLGVSGENLSTAISGPQVVMRHIEVPKMMEDELRASMKYETDIHFPFNLEDAMVDFHVLEKAKGVDENKMKVFMVAARNELVESHLKMLGEANIIPARISVDAAAIVNACEGAIDTESRCVALVNIGVRKTVIIIMGQGIFSFSREAEIGCAKLFSTISKGISISEEQAEQTVRDKITDVDAYLSSFVTDIAREIKSSIDYFEERSSEKVDAVYIDGGGSMIGDIDKRLSGELGLDVNRMNVMGEVTGKLEPGRIAEFEKLSPLFTISYGLAVGMRAAP